MNIIRRASLCLLSESMAGRNKLNFPFTPLILIKMIPVRIIPPIRMLMIINFPLP